MIAHPENLWANLPWALVSGLMAGLALWLTASGARPSRRTQKRETPGQPPDWLRRHRPVLSGAVGLGAAGLFAFPLNLILGCGAGAGVWWFIGRSESGADRREREEAQRDLAPLVELMASGLSAGAPPATAVEVACRVLPGPGANRLQPLLNRMALGGDLEQAWSSVVEDPVLAPVGRTALRAIRSGAPIAGAIARLAEDLSHEERADAEDRARAVGVKAALPLGLCLLPSFLLVGIVPVAASLLESLTG